MIEFANGTLETAKKPAPRPPKPEAKPVDAAQPAAEVTPAITSDAPSPTEVQGETPMSETTPASETEKPHTEQTGFVAPPENTVQEFQRPSDGPSSSEVKPAERPPGEPSTIETSLAQPD